MLKIILLFTIFISGCSTVGLHRDMEVDSSFTDEQKSQIVEAVDQWEKATDGMVKVNIIFTDSLDLRENTVRMFNQKDPIANNGLFGITYVTPNGQVTDNTRIFIYSGNIEATTLDFKIIVLHELGHSFGLVHEPDSLMSATPYVQSQCLDQNTLEQFCRVHFCGNNIMKSDCN